MKKIPGFARTPWMAVLAIVFVITTLSSCLKTDDDVVNQQSSGLMAFNLAPSRSAVTFTINGVVVTNPPLPYTNFTGGYVGVFPGGGNIEAYDYYSGARIAGVPATFTTGKYYSVFLVGSDTSYYNIFTEDNIDSLPYVSGRAYVRYVNAIRDSGTAPAVRISANGTDVFNGTAPFKTVSEFRAVNSGNVSVGITNENGSVNASRSIELEENKVYTVLLAGRPGGITADSVQIKFISNGTITP